MTVFSLLKGAFIVVIILGLVFTGVSVWKIWSAFDFSRNAEVKQGIFRGYYIQRSKSHTRDTTGTREYRSVEEHLPMFSYKVSGRRYEATGTETHFFRHLRGKVNEPVKVLVAPDDPKVARLGDMFSLYGPGGLMGVVSLLFIMPFWYGVRFIGRWQRAASIDVTLTESIDGFTLAKIGQMTIPVNDFVIIYRWFFSDGLYRIRHLLSHNR